MNSTERQVKTEKVPLDLHGGCSFSSAVEKKLESKVQ